MVVLKPISSTQEQSTSSGNRRPGVLPQIQIQEKPKTEVKVSEPSKPVSEPKKKGFIETAKSRISGDIDKIVQTAKEPGKIKKATERIKSDVKDVKESISKNFNIFKRSLFGEDVQKTESGRPKSVTLSDEEYEKVRPGAEKTKQELVQQLQGVLQEKEAYYSGGVRQVNPALDKREQAIRNSIEDLDVFLGNESANQGIIKSFIGFIKRNGIFPDGYASYVPEQEVNAYEKYKNGIVLDKKEQEHLNTLRAKTYNNLVKTEIPEAVAEVSAGIIPYAILIGVTKQATSGGTQAIGSTVATMPPGTLRTIAEKFVQNSVSMALASNLNIPGIDRQTAEYMLPTLEVEQKIEGDILDYVKPGDDETEARRKAYLTNLVEYVSEGAGAYIDDALPFIKKAIIGKWLSGKVDDVANPNVVKKILSTAQFNSIAGEVFEEEIAEPLQAYIEERDYFDPFFTPEGRERLLVEILGIGVFSGMARVSDTVINTFTKQRQKNGDVIEFPAKVDLEAKDVPEEKEQPLESTTEPVEAEKEQKIATKEAERPKTAEITIVKEFKVGDVLDPQGKTNMVGNVTIREVSGNTIKFVDSEGTEFSGMARSTVKNLIENESWKIVQQAEPEKVTAVKPRETKIEEPKAEEVGEGGLYDAKITNKAKKTIGITNRADEAGYITPDGKMLDFTGRHYGSGYKGGKPLPGQPDYLRGQRNVDHREVADLFEGSIDGTDAMIKFESANNIRVSPSNGNLNVSFQLNQSPTKAQINTLNDMHKELGGKIYFDIYDAKGKEILDQGETGAVKTIIDKFNKLKPNVAQQPDGEQKPKKKVKRVVKKKAKPEKKKVLIKKATPTRETLVGSKIRKIPSIKADKVYRAIVPKNVQIPVLSYINVKDGKMRMTDLDIFVEINTNMKDGVYQVVGKDMVPQDPSLLNEYPPTPETTENYGQVLDDGFAKALKKAVVSASKDEARPVLTGVRLSFEKNKIRFITTDGYRLYNTTVGSRVKKEGTLLIGATKKLNQVFLEILRGGGAVTISENKKEGYVSFENSNGKVTVRKIEGNYPEYEKIYSYVNRSIRVDKKELESALKEIAPYAKETSNITQLRIEPTKLTLWAKNSFNEDAVEKTVDIEIKEAGGEKMRGLYEGTLVMPISLDSGERKDMLKLNYKFIQDVLKTIDEKEVDINYTLKEDGTVQTLPIVFTEGKIKSYGKVKEEPPHPAEAPPKGSQASVDRFKNIKDLANSEGYYKAIQFPELVRMVRELLGVIPSVKYPRIRPTFRGRPFGLFKSGEGTKEGANIILNPDLFKSPEQAVKTFAHEIGHLADWLPDYTHRRGNLIGHVASLNNYLNHTFAGYMKQERISDLKQKRMLVQSKRATENAIAKDEGKKKGANDKQYLEEIKALNRQIKKLEKNPKLVLETVKNELKAVTQMWKPFDDEIPEDALDSVKKQMARYIKYRYSSPELYADAISVLFNDPQLLKETAPTFYDGFFASLDKKPEVKKTYFDMMDLLNKGEGAILSEREKDIREMFKKGEDLYKVKLEENRQSKHNIVFRIKNEIIDKNQRVIDLVNKAKKEGKAVADEDNPIYYLEESNYVGGVVKAWLEKNVQPVYSDLQANEVSWEDFGEALFLERVIKERGGTRNPIKILRELDNEIIEGGFSDFIKDNKDKLPEDAQNVPIDKLLDKIQEKTSDEQLGWLKNVFGDMYSSDSDLSVYEQLLQRLPLGIANPLGYDRETAEKQLDYLRSQVGEDKYRVIRRNLKKFRTAIKGLIPQAFEASLYTEEMANKMIANPAYATFQVLDYMDTYIPASVKKQVGTLKEVSNPAGATILKAISTIRAIEKNKTKIKLLGFLQKNFPDEVKDARTIWTGKSKLPIESKDKNWEMVLVMNKGKLKGYYVDPYIAQTVNTMGSGRVNGVIEVIRFFNRGLFKPLFTTYNLGFQSFNLLRDFMRYYKNIPGYNIGSALKRYAQSLSPAKNRAWDIPDKTIQEMEESKILGITYNDVISGLTDEDRMVDSVLQRYGLAKSKSSKKALFKIPLAIMDQIEKTGNFIETIPKVAGYKELNGKLPPMEMRSFIRTSVGSPDFLRKGAGYGWYNEVFLYSNAMKEGVRADYNVAFKNPRTRSGWWWKTGAFTILPKVIMYAGLLGLFGKYIKDILEKASEYDRTNYTIVPLGIDENGRGIYMRVPQDETGRFIGGFFWKMLNLTKEPKVEFSDIAEVMSYTGGQVPGISPGLSFTFAVTQFLAGQNPYDFFRGRNVIPDTEFQAGGKYALKPFVTWSINQLGGGVFWRTYYTTQAPETETWLQKVLKAPVVSNILGRWIKVSDYGQLEQSRKIIEEQKKISSQESLERRKLVDEAVEEYRKDPSPANRIKIENKLVEDTLGHRNPKNSDEKRLRTNTLKKFDIAIVEGEADANLNALIDAYTNDQKVEILKSFKSVMGEEEYRDLVRTAKDHKIISDAVLDKISINIEPNGKSVVRAISGLLDKITPEVFASEGEKEIASVSIEGDRYWIFYADGSSTNKPISDEMNKGFISQIGKVFDYVGTKLGLEEKNISEKLGYVNKSQKKEEIIKLAEIYGEKVDTKIEEIKEEEERVSSIQKENKNEKAYYIDEKIVVKGSDINKNEVETEVPEDIAKTIMDVFGDDLALEAVRTLHHPEELTNIGDEQDRGINKDPNRGENPDFVVSNIDATNSDGSKDRGLFRINSYSFSEMWNRTFDNGKTYPIRAKMRKLGITSYSQMDNLEKNVKMAKLIYDEGGWQRWFASPRELREK